MAGKFVRQDIWTLEQQQPWHPVTIAYALAVREMRRRDAEDPTSWAVPDRRPLDRRAQPRALPGPVPAQHLVLLPLAPDVPVLVRAHRRRHRRIRCSWFRCSWSPATILGCREVSGITREG
jgi:hypothetical protein